MHGMHVDKNNDPKPKAIDCQHLHFRVLKNEILFKPKPKVIDCQHLHVRVLKNEILFNLIAHHMSVKTYIFHDCQHLHLRVLKK